MSESNDFVVLAKPRSGSTWVIDVLNRHPDLEAFDEVFHPSATRENQNFGSQRMPFFNGSDHKGGSIRPISTFSYLRRLFARDHAVGFKMIYAQARRNPDAMLFAFLRHVKIIHLVRENQLDALISLEAAKATKCWHLTEADEENPPVAKIRLDTNRLLTTLVFEYQRIDRFRRLLRFLRLPTLEVPYEKLQADPGAFDGIWRFLGATPPPGELESMFRRVRTQSYAEIIENWAKVRDCLAASPYRHLIG